MSSEPRLHIIYSPIDTVRVAFHSARRSFRFNDMKVHLHRARAHTINQRGSAKHKRATIRISKNTAARIFLRAGNKLDRKKEKENKQEKTSLLSASDVHYESTI